VTRYPSRRFSFALSCASIAVTAILTGTAAAGSMGSEPASAVADSSAPALDLLLNASYHGVGEADSLFTLSDGSWKGSPAAKGAASVPAVTLVRDFRLAGDLDGDGREDAVVVLAASTGGTGEMSYLAVVARDGAGSRNVATAAVGDRVQLRAGRIEGRRVVLDLVQAGADDAACCPGDLVTRSWELKSGSLLEGERVVTGRLSLEALVGADWILRAWNVGDAAPASPAVSLKLDGGRFVGSSGCNRYFTDVRPGPMPGDLSVGRIGATRMVCGEAENAVETRFLQRLAGARRMQFVAGRLGLSYAAADGHHGVMLFERRSQP